MRIVGGQWKGRGLAAPRDRQTRPTSDRTREALFSILAASADCDLEGSRVLDLFAGTGALGFEALSRGAVFALFVDTQPGARAVLRENTQALGAQGISKIFRRDAVRLGQMPGSMAPGFNLVFADPPYGKGLAEQALIGAAGGGWLAPDALIIVEEDRRSGFTPPPAFDLQDERSYGDTLLYFLKLSDRA
ncbi:MAG: 16S rRNA (guanine(966)-N(2))-methyltransferase RsmD [Parvibaculales bacterium]